MPTVFVAFRVLCRALLLSGLQVPAAFCLLECLSESWLQNTLLHLRPDGLLLVLCENESYATCAIARMVLQVQSCKERYNIQPCWPLCIMLPSLAWF